MRKAYKTEREVHIIGNKRRITECRYQGFIDEDGRFIMRNARVRIFTEGVRTTPAPFESSQVASNNKKHIA